MMAFMIRIIRNIYYHLLDLFILLGYTTLLLISNQYFFNDIITTTREICIVGLLHAPLLLNTTFFLFSRWILSSWVTYCHHTFALIFYESYRKTWRKGFTYFFTTPCRRLFSSKTEEDSGQTTQNQESSLLQQGSVNDRS